MTDDLWNNLSDEARAAIAKDPALAIELGFADWFKEVPGLPKGFYARFYSLKPEVPITPDRHGRRASRIATQEEAADEDLDRVSFTRRRLPAPSLVAWDPAQDDIGPLVPPVVVHAYRRETPTPMTEDLPYRAPLRPYLPSQDEPGFLRRRSPSPSSITPERMRGPWREMTPEEVEHFGPTTVTYDELARLRSAERSEEPTSYST